MSEDDPCPGPDELIGLLLGQLPLYRSADLEEHLNGCDRCLAAVERLQVESHILDVLKEAPRGNLAVVPPDLEQLMSRLEGMHQPSRGPGSSTEMRTDDSDFPLLGRAENSEELGRLAHFRVLELVGAGGMGVVYLAQDAKLQRRVALKVLRPRTARDPDARARFLSEARAMASIKHDHVVVVHEVGEACAVEGGPSTPYLAMELLDGESFQGWTAAHRRAPLGWVVRLGRQIAEALAALHARGLIHRDVKPANLWLEPPAGWQEEPVEERPPLGQVGRAKLLDFGLAFTMSDALAEARALGTPAYMAPEQLRGETLDGRCDLFGLGCVLYELCTGEHPFPDRRFSPVHTPPFPASDVNPAVPAELSHLIGRLLAEDRASRPESARRVVRELAALEKMLPRSEAEETVRQLQTGLTPIQTPGRRRRWGLAAASGLVLAVVAVLVGWQVVHPLSLDVPVQPPSREVVATPVAPAEPIPRPAFPGGPPDDVWCADLMQRQPREHLKLVVHKLTELNPGYKPTKIQGWFEPEAAIRFSERTDFLSDIRPLHCLADLKTLHLDGSAAGRGKLIDLAPLKGMRLFWLIIARNPHLHDLSPLKGMPLFKIDITDTGVTSLAPLTGALLEHVMMMGSRVKDLGPVATLSKLRILDCRGCPFESLAPLAGSPILDLHLDYRPERDEAVLKRMSHLEHINDLSVKEFWRRQSVRR